MNKVEIKTSSIKKFALDMIKLREALKQIEQMSDSGDPLTTVINMKSIATEALKK